MKCMFSRLAAQFLKPTLALLAACIVGGAWADFFWTAGGGTDTDWNTAANWSGTLDNTANYVFGGNESSDWVKGKDITVTFAGAYSAIPAAGIWIENVDSSGDGFLTWTADTADHGLALTGNLNLGTGTSSNLKLTKGSYTVSGGIYIANGAGTSISKLQIDGASLTVNGALTSEGDYKDGNNNVKGVGLYGTFGHVNGIQIDVANGTLAVPNADVLLVTRGTWGNSTGYVNVNIGVDGVLSCGTESAPHTLTCGLYGDDVVTLNIATDGTLETSAIVKGSANSTINFNGGSIKALSSDTLLGAGLDVVVNSAGGVIDTNGKHITIDAAITGSGVLTIRGGGSVTLTAAPTCSMVVDGDTYVYAKALTTFGNGSNTSSLTVNSGSIRFYEDVRLGDGNIGTMTISGTEGHPAVVSCQGYKDGEDTGKWIVEGYGSGNNGCSITVGAYGTLKFYRIQHFKANTATQNVYLNGGTLEALASGELFGDNWNDGNTPPTINVGASGGTINTSTFDTSIDATVTGEGELIKAGTGNLELKGTVSGVAITVPENCGAVTLPSNSSYTLGHNTVVSSTDTGSGTITLSYGDTSSVTYTTDTTLTYTEPLQLNSVTVSAGVTLTLNGTAALTTGTDTLTVAGEGSVVIADATPYAGKTVSVPNGTLVIPAGSTFADISATTVKVTGTVTGTTVAADGTIGAGSTLFTLTGAAPTFDNSTVTVSINNTDTPIHYTKSDNGVYTAGKVFYWISNSTANTTSNPDNYVEYDYCWSTTEGGAFVEGERPLYCDTAIFNKSGKSAMTHSDMPYNIKVMSDFYFHSKDKSSKETDGRTVGVSGLTTFFVANDATAYISVDAGSWYNNTKLVSTVLGGNRSRIVAQGYATNSSIRFNGDMSSYEGVVDIRIADNQRGSIVGIYEGALDSKYTRWYVSTNGVYAYRSDNNAPTMFKSEGTFKMGLLRAYISDSHSASSYANKNVVLELGENLDEDSWLRNAWCVQNATYGGKVKWLAKTATFTNAVANAYEVDILGGGNVYVEKDATTAANFVPSVVKFLAYTSGDNDVRGGGYLTLDGSNSAIAGNIVNAIAVAGDGETQVATGFNVAAVDGGVSAAVTKTAVLNNAVGFNKKGAGTLMLSGAFTKLGVVNVSEGLLVIEATSALTEGDDFTCAAGTLCTSDGNTYTFGTGVATFNDKTYQTVQAAVDAAETAGGGTVTLLASVAEDVVIEAAGVSIVLGDYTITGTVTSSEDYDLVYDEDTKTWTSSETANFIWCGGNGTSWNTPGNWKKGSVPGETDTVVFPTTNAEGGWTVALGEERTVASGQFDGKVTLIGAYLKTAAITGAGMIVLGDDAGLKYSGEAEVANPIEIAGTAGHPNKLYADGVRCTFSGPLSGAGDLELVASTDGMGVVLKGLNTMTSGTITVRAALGGGKRNASAIYSKASSAAVSWQIENGTGNRSDYKWNWLAEGDKEYVFGSVGNSTINTPNGTKNAVLTIGGLGQTDSLAGWFVVETTPSREWNTSYSRITIKKVGSGVLSVSSHSVYDYEIAEGVLELSADHARPAPTYGKVKFSGNGTLKLADAFTVDISENIAAVTDEITCPIVVDIGTASSVARIWDTAIPANYGGGFTKKGAGTLTLSQPPAYTGTTKVEAGALYVIVDSENPFNPKLDSSTAEVTTDKEGYRKFVPASVAISAPKVVWGDDFAKVTVSAAVTSNYGEGGLAYNLKIGGNVVDGAVGTVNNGVVTFSDVNVSGLNLSRYGDVAVEVTASAGGSQAATSGSKNVMFADTIDWVNENYETTTTAAAGGAWQTAVTYDATTHKAAVVDNKFSATNCTTGDVVTVTIDDVVYTGLSDLTSADTDAQGAVAVGGTEAAPKFMLLTKKNDTVGWYEAAGVTPVLETGVYDIVMTFDYISNTYKVTVNGTPLTVGDVAAVPLAKAQTSVKDIDFLGAGSLAAINGVQYEGKMAIDQNGRKYATVAEALEANASVKGAVIKLLHGSATTSAEGWNFDSETKTFVKKVIGLIFLAF